MKMGVMEGMLVGGSDIYSRGVREKGVGGGWV